MATWVSLSDLSPTWESMRTRVELHVALLAPDASAPVTWTVQNEALAVEHGCAESWEKAAGPQRAEGAGHAVGLRVSVCHFPPGTENVRQHRSDADAAPVEHYPSGVSGVAVPRPAMTN